ncbi:MAG TPA: hypothetical protein DIT64_08055 [Verrucomicrobiales bacterium]|nr:hypothetical protein [Verrucomicrobiales bacterium]
MKRFPHFAACAALCAAHVTQAATLTVSNYNAAANGFHAISDNASTRIAPGTGGGVIGRMATLTDEQVNTHVASGNIAALNADFRVFGSPFALDLTSTGPDGALEKAVSFDTRVSSDPNNFGGNAIYAWLYKGASRTSATEYFLVKLSQNFPTDPEDLPPLGPIEVPVRPGTIATLYAGAAGPGTFDYGFGSGPLTILRMQATGSSGNNAPVAENKTINVLAGVPFNSSVTATDPDLDSLTFSKVADPIKGDLTFNSNGTFTYTADGGESGQDSFTFKANDGTDDSNTATVTINIQTGGTLAQTISFDAPAQRQVGDAPFDLMATASSGLPVSFQILSGPANLAGSTVTLTGAAGVVQVRATQAGDSTFDPAPPVDRHFHVVPVSTKFNLINLVQTYTGGPLSVGVTGVPLTGLVITYNGSQNLPVNAGSYNVLATSGTLKKTGKLTINKAPLTVTADNQRKLIGQPNPALTFNYSGFLGADDENSVFPPPPAPPAKPTATVPVISTTAKDLSPGGRYPITFKGGLAVNYRFVFVPGTLVVDSFEGRYENLLVSPDTMRAIAKVELTVAKTIKDNKMAFTGKLWTPTDTAALPIKGTLTVDPLTETATGTWTLNKLVNKVAIAYEMTINLDIGGGFEAILDVDGDLFAEADDGARVFVPAKGQIVTNAGLLTLILAPPLPAFGAVNPIPLGSGHATGSVDAKAVMKLTLTLADGIKTTATLMPGVDGGYRLFVNPYKRLNSYLAGWLDLLEHPDLPGRGHIPTMLMGDSLAWAKAAGPKDKSYRGGIDLMDCGITLDPWRKPAKATKTLPEIALLNELGITDSTVISIGHSGFAGVDAGLLPTEVTMAANGKVTVQTPAGNPAVWQITINTATGGFTGKFTLKNEKTRTVNFSGVLRRKLSTNPADFIGRGNFQLPALPSDPTPEIQSGDIQLFVP